jgi:phage terminase large subunit
MAVREIEVELNYIPNDRQRVFHQSRATECVYGGAKGGGKTCGLVIEALFYGLEYPGADIYIFRESYDDLEANVIKEWKQRVPQELYEYNESKHVATLRSNGTTIKFRYIQNDADAESYDGRSMTG